MRWLFVFSVLFLLLALNAEASKRKKHRDRERTIGSSEERRRERAQLHELSNNQQSEEEDEDDKEEKKEEKKTDEIKVKTRRHISANWALYRRHHGSRHRRHENVLERNREIGELAEKKKPKKGNRRANRYADLWDQN